MPENNIIGRNRELHIFRSIINSQEAEFLAVYGRRRVGKTFIIREFFGDKGTFFEITGQKDGKLSEQLANFSLALSKQFFKEIPLSSPKNWKEAFHLLNTVVEKCDPSKKFILFLDELPWLASKKSQLIQVLDHFWNTYWSKKKNFILIVCGSAASWMLDKLINAKGGLYNRLTRSILLRPYDLGETKHFLQKLGIRLNNLQILDLYMAVGGIPYYLKQVIKGYSSVQNINQICFRKDGLLYSEFDRLFDSLFEHSENHESIVKAIATQRSGISRNDLIKATKLSSGGTLNKYLSELEASDLIKTYIPFGKKNKDKYFRINDPYIYFYLQWIQPLKNKGIDGGESYWNTLSKTSKANSWKGYAFESICLNHVDKIKKALGIEAIHTEMGSWRFLPKKGKHDEGAQIDLLFDRDDRVVTLCEIKCSEQLFTVDKECAKDLANKLMVFDRHFPKKKQHFVAIITPFGIKETIWSEDLVQNVITLDDLFGD